MKLIQKSHSFLIFIFGFSLLLFYLIGIRNYYEISVDIFWVSSILIIFIIVYQIGTFEDSEIFIYLILIEIYFLSILFHYIVQIPTYGLIGNDAHFDYGFANLIKLYGWPIPETISIHYVTTVVSNYPIMHINGLCYSYFSDLDLFSVAKWFPAIYSSVTIFLVYAISMKIYQNKKGALLFSLCFSLIQWHLFFHSLFVREGISFILFFLLLFIILFEVKNENRLSIKNNSLIIIRTLGIIISWTLLLAHHLSTFLMMLLTFTYLTSNTVIDRLISKIRPLNIEKIIHFNSNFILLFFCMVISWWIFFEKFTFVTLIRDLNSIVFGKSQAQVIQSYIDVPVYLPARSIIIYNIEWFLTIGFGLLIMYKLLKLKSTNVCYANLFFVALMFLLVTFFNTPELKSYFIKRLHMYAYPFILLICCDALFQIRSNKKLYYVALGLFIFFMIFNIYKIDPIYYDHSIAPEYQYGYTRPYMLPQEYAAISKIEYSDFILSDPKMIYLLGGLQQKTVRTKRDVFNSNFGDIDNYNWVIIRDEMLAERVPIENANINSPSGYISKDNFDNINNFNRLNEIYNNGMVYSYCVNKASS